MISDNIKRIINSGSAFSITLQIEPTNNKHSSTIIECIEKIKNLEGVEVGVKCIMIKRGKLPEKPWRRKGLVYQAVESVSGLKYTTIEDVLVIGYDGVHFKTTWDVISKASQVSEGDLNKKVIDDLLGARLSSKSLIGLILFLKAYNRGDIKAPENTNTQEVVLEPEVVSEPEIEKPKAAPKQKERNIPEEHLSIEELRSQGIIRKLRFKEIQNETHIEFATYNDTIIVRFGEIMISTSWNEVESLAKLDHEIMKKKIFKRFPESGGSRGLLIGFISIYKKGNVKALEDEQIDSSAKPISTKETYPSWENIKAIAVKGDSTLSYKTVRDNVLICRNRDCVLFNWTDTIRLAKYRPQRIIEELTILRYMESEIKILFDFITAYRDDRAIDPDMGFRKILSTETSTNYDGNKVEGSLEG